MFVYAFRFERFRVGVHSTALYLAWPDGCAGLVLVRERAAGYSVRYMELQLFLNRFQP